MCSFSADPIIWKSCDPPRFPIMVIRYRQPYFVTYFSDKPLQSIGCNFFNLKKNTKNSTARTHIQNPCSIITGPIRNMLKMLYCTSFLTFSKDKKLSKCDWVNRGGLGKVSGQTCVSEKNKHHWLFHFDWTIIILWLITKKLEFNQPLLQNASGIGCLTLSSTFLDTCIML